MTKRCSLCDYRTDDPTAFREHMNSVHGWDQMMALMEHAKMPPAGAFLLGAALAFGFNFVLALVTFGSRPDPTLIILAWIVTIGGFALLYRMHHWAAFGALGLYAALFFILSIVGGANGPYTCFNAYGYPSGH